eukprot:2317373-Pyramimonas_sp.AAC.1
MQRAAINQDRPPQRSQRQLRGTACFPTSTSGQPASRMLGEGPKADAILSPTSSPLVKTVCCPHGFAWMDSSP